MTTEEIVRVFHGKRSGRGKWFAKCPCHNRNGKSLYITAKDLGKTTIYCFGGCDTRDVLAAMGLTFSDLFPDGKRDREAEKLAQKARDEAEAKRQQVKRELVLTIDESQQWARARDSLGLLLMQRPHDSKLNTAFHRSCSKARELDVEAVTIMAKMYGMKPEDLCPGDPLASKTISARIVGEPITTILKLR